MLDLNKCELDEARSILRQYLQPGVEVFAYGSRTKQSARQFSDLDLVIRAELPISQTIVAVIRESFSESNLPFKTDLSDWSDMSLEFQNHIEGDLVQII